MQIMVIPELESKQFLTQMSESSNFSIRVFNLATNVGKWFLLFRFLNIVLYKTKNE